MKTIRQLRQDQGWTQFELALRVGVQPQAVYYWERGRRLPQLPQMRALGQLFGICSDEIDLEPRRERTDPPGHQARAERHAGEVRPGRGPDGRAITRGRDAAGCSGFPSRPPMCSTLLSAARHAAGWPVNRLREAARRPTLAALSEADVRELAAIKAALRPTPDDPSGVVSLTRQQLARVRALAAKAWGAT